ncbi:MAG: histidine kinase [Bacteroidetes bacterium]|nr:histidine kinase [Bacteroidota bacterium]
MKETSNIKENIGKIKVLIVEDNVLNQKMASFLLKGLGFNNDVCVNGKVALDKIKTTNYDVVLMDVQMPEMDGYEATRQIRNELKLHMPIIATIGNTSEEEIKKCLANGMTDVISKPLKGDELYAMINKHLFPENVSENVNGSELD